MGRYQVTVRTRIQSEIIVEAVNTDEATQIARTIYNERLKRFRIRVNNPDLDIEIIGVHPTQELEGVRM